MKKISHQQQKYYDRRSRKHRFKKNSKKQLHKRKNLRDKNFTHQIKTDITINAPKTIRINKEEDHKTFNEFIHKIEKNLNDYTKIKLKLNHIEELWPCGTLVFLAKLDVWQKKFPGKMVAIDYPKDFNAEELLQHVGALKKLGLNHRRTITSDNVKFWHYKTGTNTDPQAYKELTETIISNINHQEAPLFADCLNEAVNNSVAHAYNPIHRKTSQTAVQNWWILSELKGEQVFVAIFDAGITIPSSIRSKEEWKLIRAIKSWKDGKLLEAVISSSRTSTNLPERGKGLPEMLEFSKNLTEGGLSIISGKAYFNYNAKIQENKRRTINNRVPGTLILWSIPFQKMRSENE